MQKELTRSMLEVTEQSRGEEEEEVSVLQGWLPWQLPLLWVQAPLHPAPRQQLCRCAAVSAQLTATGHQRSHCAAPAAHEGLNHCLYIVAEKTHSLLLLD